MDKSSLIIDIGKYGILGIILGTVIIIIINTFWAPFIGGIIGGFIARKTINGVLAAVLGGLIMVLINNALIGVDGPFWIVLTLIFVLIFAIMGVISGFIGAAIGWAIFPNKDVQKSDEIDSKSGRI